MQSSRANQYIILALAFYFGWLLSFPFYGPVLYVAATMLEYRGLSMPFVFTLFHALTFLTAGLLFANVKIWKQVMIVSLGLSLATSMALLFSPPPVWPWAMAVLGVAAAAFTISWSYPFTTFVSMGTRLKTMASVIIGANIVYITFNHLSRSVSPTLLLILSGIPLCFALLPLIFFPAESGLKPPLAAPLRKGAVFPAPLLLTLCLFIAGLYLSSGFMYNILQPFLSGPGSLLIYYRYLPYITVLVIMLYCGERLQRYFMIYMGVSLLGLAFVSFALLYRSTAGRFITTTLIEAAFAFLDLFVWTTLGDLAFIYGAPFQFFGYALAAMLFSILVGELIGVELLKIGEHHRLVTALFAAAAIFLTYTVIPWLNERMQKDLYRFLSNDYNEGENAGNNELKAAARESKAQQSALGRALKLLLPHQKITPRETEITALLLKGLTNREIAAQLFISENTLKTHLRNIYPKFGVAQKRELLSLVLDEKNHDLN